MNIFPNKLSILIPVYNESKTIGELLDKINNVSLVNNFVKELIIVDDQSTDNTFEVLQKYQDEHPALDIQLHQHPKNQGKGAAIHTAITHATGEYCIVQDADLEYDPQEYNILLYPAINGFADVVYGSRFVGGRAHRILFYWHSIGNKLLTSLSNVFTNLNLTDMETCYKLVRTSLLKQIKLKEKRFGFDPEITAKLARIPQVRIYEVGISYYGRTYTEGKKIGWKDGFRVLYCILKYNLFSK